MSFDGYLSAPQVACFANDNDAFIPERWAQEGLALLSENMVMANQVHRDFESEVRQFGDVVNTRRPGTFQIRRKVDGVSVSQQDAVATNVRVPLDQWFYQSYTIKDGEASKSFQELIQVYLLPAIQTMGRGVDRALLGRGAQAFLAAGQDGVTAAPTKRVGHLRGLTSSNAKDTVLEAREILNVNKAYVDGRNLVLSPSSETALLKTELFIAANQRGDGGNALENARLGRILGFDCFMDQNVNAILPTGADIATGTVTNALAADGSGSQVCSVVGYAANVGEYATVAGNDQPAIITAATVAADTTAVTLSEANKYASGAGAVIVVYKKCDVAADYAAGYSQAVLVDGWTAGKAPQVGQLISFGTGANRHTYTIIESYLSSAGVQALYLDRPLDAAVANNALAFPGPAGSFNLAFHRDALALVSRPLALPNQSMGVNAGVVADNGLAMRVTMQYDIQAQGTVVNLDVLAGVAVLDKNLAVVMLG
jgi:hypothetical protein